MSELAANCSEKHSQILSSALKAMEEWCTKYKIPEDHGASHAIIVAKNAKNHWQISS